MNKRKYFDVLGWVKKAVVVDDATRPDLDSPHFDYGMLMATDGRRLHVVEMEEPPEDYVHREEPGYRFKQVPNIIPEVVHTMKVKIGWKGLDMKTYYKYCKATFGKSLSQKKIRAKYSPTLRIEPHTIVVDGWDGLVKVEGWPEWLDDAISINLFYLRDACNGHDEFELGLAGSTTTSGTAHRPVTLTCDYMPRAKAVIMPLRYGEPKEHMLDAIVRGKLPEDLIV